MNLGWKLLKAYCREEGIPEQRMRGAIEGGHLKIKEHWSKAPDGHIFINLLGMETLRMEINHYLERLGREKFNEFERIGGVYVLYHGRKVVYVGQSRNILARIAAHVTRSKMTFTAYRYIDVPLDHRTVMEMELIRRYQPKYNIVGKPADDETDGTTVGQFEGNEGGIAGNQVVETA